MRPALQRARRFYQIPLGPDEQIESTSTGYAGGTGRMTMIGTLGGTLVGWIYNILTEGASVPSLALGAFAGIGVGYLLAERAARRPNGPGATTFTIVLTTHRFLTLKRQPAFRPRVLRSLERQRITAVSARRLPVGHYHRYELTTAAGTLVTVVATEKLDIEPVNALPTSG